KVVVGTLHKTYHFVFLRMALEHKISEESLRSLSRTGSIISINSRTDLIKDYSNDFTIGAPPIDTTSENQNSKIKKYIKILWGYCKDVWKMVKSKRCRQEVLRTTMAVL